MLQLLHKLLDLLNKREKINLSFVIILQIFVGFFEIAGIASIVPIISIMSDPSMMDTHYIIKIYANFLDSLGIKDVEWKLITLGATSFLILTISAFFRSYGIYITTKFVEMRRHTISSKLLNGFLSKNYDFFALKQSSDLTKTILSEVDRIVAQLIRPIIIMVSYIFLVLSVLSFLVIITPVISIIIISGFGFVYAVIYSSVRKKVNFLGHQTVNANKLRFSVTMEAFQNIKFIKFENLENFYSRKYMKASHLFSSSVALQFTISQIPKYVVELIAFGGIILASILHIISTSQTNDSLTSNFFPILATYALSAYKLQPAIQAIFNGIVSIRYGEAALNNLFESIDEIQGDDVTQPNSPNNGAQLLDLSFDNELRCEDLEFHYSGHQERVIRNLNLTVKYGTTVGIIGNTGSGKSTLVNLLLGLLRPSQGRLSVDGRRIDCHSEQQWRKIVGYVPQEVNLIDATIIENIAFGIHPSSIDHDHALHCARLAQIEEHLLVAEREIFVGEGGCRLSGGQKQRVGIARALYKKPRILILDEATSSLDPKTEQILLTQLSAHATNLTTIMITHRYSNLNYCDHVFEMVDGKLGNWNHDNN